MKLCLQYYMGRYFVMIEENCGEYPFSSRKWKQYTPCVLPAMPYEFPESVPEFKELFKTGVTAENVGHQLLEEAVKFEKAKRDWCTNTIIKEIEL